ncbi:hypothetical protein JHK82_011981 [Glycine max]|nr:hypothetical protein JHK82_011981 [Glycine max]
MDYSNFPAFVRCNADKSLQPNKTLVKLKALGLTPVSDIVLNSLNPSSALPFSTYPAMIEFHVTNVLIDICWNNLSANSTLPNFMPSNHTPHRRSIKTLQAESKSPQATYPDTMALHEKQFFSGIAVNNLRVTKKMFPGLEGFPNHTENATDVQDGMDRLSKLLDGISSVHNEAVFIGYLLITIIIDDPVSLETRLNVVVNHYSLFQVPISINYRLLDDQREGVRF